jgi:hypothetical protein
MTPLMAASIAPGSKPEKSVAGWSAPSQRNPIVGKCQANINVTTNDDPSQ